MKIQDERQTMDDRNIQIYTRMLNEVLVKDVVAEIEKEIMPIIKAKIKELAIESVSHWATHIREQKSLGAYDVTTQISIDFVEEVIQTQMKENPISITVKK